jgi:hypothetical protein
MVSMSGATQASGIPHDEASSRERVGAVVDSKKGQRGQGESDHVGQIPAMVPWRATDEPHPRENRAHSVYRDRETGKSIKLSPNH